MTINNKFNIGDIVYLKTDPDQLERMIVGIKIISDNPIYLMYIISFIDKETECCDFELSKNKDVLKTLK